MTTPRDQPDGANRPAAPVAVAPARRPRPIRPDTIKGTLAAIVLAFALTLVFRAFVVEAFIIPTGSMAPTLLGRHVRAHGYDNGFSWTINAHRAGAVSEAEVVEPITRLRLLQRSLRPRPGDRILVLKHAYALRAPARWDVVVFKNPERHDENYIKRLIGLPNERVWIVDGDVFVQRADARNEHDARWRIARKPPNVQRRLWWPLFSAEASPLDGAPGGAAWEGPWRIEGDAEWRDASRTLAIASPNGARLRWDADRWPLTDWTPYNDPLREAADPARAARANNTADLRIRAGVTAHAEGLALDILLSARGHEFRALLHNGHALLLMRADRDDDWTELARAEAQPFTPGRSADIEFWHADQALSLWIDGARVLAAPYDWGPWERLAHTSGVAENDLRALAAQPGRNLFEQRDLALPARVEIDAHGAPATIHRLGLDRDIHYTAATYLEGLRAGDPAMGTHPDHTASLRDDQFFVLGDNSSASKDSRLWDRVDPWVGATIDPTPGVVHRDLMLGKAFFVYFPAPHDVVVGRRVYNIVPDLGRTRFIR